MVDAFGYAGWALRAGGDLADEAGASADAVRARWGDRRIDGLIFGDVEGAEDLGGELTSSVGEMVGTARGLRDRHLDLYDRSYSTAGLGEQLDVDLAVIARSATPAPVEGPITRGMRG